MNENKHLKFCTITSVEVILKNPKKELSEENPIKAYKLTVEDIDGKNYTVVSAITDIFKPEDLLNKKSAFNFGYPPKEIRGVMSEAMIILNEQTVPPSLFTEEEFNKQS